jgi:hypothetical protein
MWRICAKFVVKKCFFQQIQKFSNDNRRLKMENFPATLSNMWSAYTTTGVQFIQKTVLVMSDYQMSEFEALFVLLGSSFGFLIWLALMFKRPKKITYLMEGGHRYYRP